MTDIFHFQLLIIEIVEFKFNISITELIYYLLNNEIHLKFAAIHHLNNYSVFNIKIFLPCTSNCIIYLKCLKYLMKHIVGIVMYTISINILKIINKK